MNTANNIWTELLANITSKGKLVRPAGKECLELIGHTSVVSMQYPIVTNVKRNVGYKFMAAEAAWILSGGNRVDQISKYSPNIVKYSDNGITFFGAYGPKVIAQIPYVIDTLVKDRESRRAVINIWRESPPNTLDYPCTLSLQFLIRDEAMHCIASMRSSDAWIGWIYDIFNFSMITFYIMLELKSKYSIYLRVGELRLTVGSQHLYSINEDCAKDIIKNIGSTEELWINPIMFINPIELVNFLWEAANGPGINKAIVKRG